MCLLFYSCVVSLTLLTSVCDSGSPALAAVVFKPNFQSGGTEHFAGQAGSAESGFQYLATNIVWSAHEQMDVGLKYMYGKRENKDGWSGEAHRLHLEIWFYLP